MLGPNANDRWNTSSTVEREGLAGAPRAESSRAPKPILGWLTSGLLLVALVALGVRRVAVEYLTFCVATEKAKAVKLNNTLRERNARLEVEIGATKVAGDLEDLAREHQQMHHPRPGERVEVRGEEEP